MRQKNNYKIGDKIRFPHGSGKTFTISDMRYTKEGKFKGWEYQMSEIKNEWWRECTMELVGKYKKKRPKYL